MQIKSQNNKMGKGTCLKTEARKSPGPNMFQLLP